MAKEKAACSSKRKHSKAKHQAVYRARLKTDAENGQLEAEITGKELLQVQEEQQKIKSSMRYKLKKSKTLLKYMYVPEAENIQL